MFWSTPSRPYLRNWLNDAGSDPGADVPTRCNAAHMTNSVAWSRIRHRGIIIARFISPHHHPMAEDTDPCAVADPLLAQRDDEASEGEGGDALDDVGLDDSSVYVPDTVPYRGSKPDRTMDGREDSSNASNSSSCT